MAMRVAEHVVRSRLFGPKIRFRVDLHGVSTFGPGEERTLIRWEWVDSIGVEEGSVVVSSTKERITVPDGAFGFSAHDLAERLEAARSITRRPEVIGELQGL